MKEEVDYIYDIPKFSKKASIENTGEMLRRIGFDESTKKIIHIAGTNGKGSVCAYLAGMLTLAGKKTGLFTSPHLVRMNERIVLNGEEINDALFEESFARIKTISLQMVEAGFVHPSFFEFLFGMAMDVFMRSDVEYIVLETGLGGRLDATNAIKHPILTIITSIGLDHTDILGDTYEKIAFEKAGIIKENVPVIFMDKREDVTKVIEEVAAKKNAPVISFSAKDIKDISIKDKNIDFCLYNKYYDSVYFSVNSRGIYQVENGATAAIAAKEVLLLDEKTIHDGLMNVSWTGRMQKLSNGMIIDGAHNDDGVNMFLESVANDKWEGRRILLFSAVKDKHYEGMVEKLCQSGFFDQIVTGVLDDARGIDKSSLIDAFAKYPEQKVEFCDSIRAAYEKAWSISDENDLIYVAGSLYLVGEILDITKEF